MPAASMRNEITPSAARPRARSTAMRALPQRGLALVLTIRTAGASCVGQSGVDRIPNRDSPGPKRTGVSRAPPTLSDVALFGTATRDKPVAAGWDITQRTMRSKAVCGTSAACESRCMRFRSWNTSNAVVVPASCNDSASASTAGRLSDSINSAFVAGSFGNLRRSSVFSASRVARSIRRPCDSNHMPSSTLWFVCQTRCDMRAAKVSSCVN